MACFLFTKAIFAGEPIKVFNDGKMQRDFTYIDDIVNGILRVSKNFAKPSSSWDSINPDPGTSSAPYRIYNIGNNQPIILNDFLDILQEEIGKKASIDYLPLQPGDVVATYANIDDIQADVGYKPTTDVRTGLKHFIKWYKEFYC